MKIYLMGEKISYTVVYDHLNNPIRAIGSGIDITEEFIDQTRYKEQINVISTFELNSIGSFRFNLTKNWCGDGYSPYPSVLKLQEAGTVDGFIHNMQMQMI